MIALLCPTRDREKQYRRMVDSAVATSGSVKARGASADLSLIRIFSASNGGDNYAARRFPKDIPTVHMWNRLAKEAYDVTDVKLFMLASDDIIFSTPRWDEALLDHYEKLENKIHVYHLQDSRDPDGTPHPIVTREYIGAMGYFLPPLFMHWYVDSWTVSIAKANNCFTHLKDYELIHDKPSDRGEADQTHNHIRSMGWHERDKCVNDTCQHLLEFEKQRLAKAIAL